MPAIDRNPADYPDYRSDAWSHLAKEWDKTDTVLAGTQAMRAAAEWSLPQFPAEHDEVYADRVATATFDNDYADTLDGIVGMIYRRPIRVGDDVAIQLKENLENVDLAGTHFDVFAPRFTRRGIHQGAAYILVDMQRKPDNLADMTLDAGQAAELNLRPYWTSYGVKDVQNEPRYVVIRGAQTLQQIVFRECAYEPVGAFGEDEVTRYLVWRLPVVRLGNGQYAESLDENGRPYVEWEIWQEIESDNQNTTVDIRLMQSGIVSLSRIPVAPFIANPDPDDEKKCAGPTLNDLADLCIKDFQQQSDHEANLHLCNSPIPFTVNLRDDGEQTEQAWGKGVRYDVGEGGMVGYAEPAGTGLQAMERQLAKNKEMIRQKGLEMVLEGGAANTTATEQVLRAGKRASRLSMITMAVHDCFEAALGFSAEWLKLGTAAGGSLTMGIKGDELILTAQDVAALSTQAEKEQLSLRTMWGILQRGGILPDDFDPESELDLIAEERGRMFEQDLDEQVQRQDVMPAPVVKPAFAS